MVNLSDTRLQRRTMSTRVELLVSLRVRKTCKVRNCAKGCTGCQLTQFNPKTAPLHSWEWSARPWQRIHVDVAGPFSGTMFPIVVDVQVKWSEGIPMTTTSASRTVDELRKLFATHGLPKQLVTVEALLTDTLVSGQRFYFVCFERYDARTFVSCYQTGIFH